jgi:hypothetical protein
VYSPQSIDLELLRALCERQGVSATDDDLLAVQGFLRAIMPALEELERTIPDDTPAAP